MIQIIGVMIGYYILTRMLEILHRGETNGIKGFAAAGIIITIICLIMIFAEGQELMKYVR